MPIYVYERPDGSRFEIRQGFNDLALTADPETGVSVRRILQPAPVIFKGSGWYKTDNRATAPASNGATESKAADAAPATEKGASGTTSEATPAKAASDAVPTKPTPEAKKAADKIASQAAS